MLSFLLLIQLVHHHLTAFFLFLPLALTLTRHIKTQLTMTTRYTLIQISDVNKNVPHKCKNLCVKEHNQDLAVDDKDKDFNVRGTV